MMCKMRLMEQNEQGVSIQNLLILICGLLIVVLLLTRVIGLWLILIVILLLLILLLLILLLVLVITLVVIILLPIDETISHSLFIKSILISAMQMRKPRSHS